MRRTIRYQMLQKPEGHTRNAAPLFGGGCVLPSPIPPVSSSPRDSAWTKSRATSTTRQNSTSYYYRARYYDQSTGRFLAEDPIRFRSDQNIYRYVRNRPTVFRDPTGKWAGGGGLNVAGIIGTLLAAGAAEGSCMVVHDSQGNWGVLCCLAFGGGVAAGADVGVSVTGIACPTCKTICDLQGGFAATQGFGAIGGGLSGGGTLSIGLNQITLSGNIGVAGGVGGGVAVLGGSCKLILGGKNCSGSGCPANME